MRIETPPETISREAALFGLMVGAIATAAMASLGGVPFLIALLGGGALFVIVWFVITKLGSDLPPPRDAGNVDAAPAVSAQAPAAPVPAAAGVQPAGLSMARDGMPDDLKQIKGVGPKLEEMLNGMGYYHFDQIAAWTAGEVAWVDDNLEGFKGRVSRDDWVGQAQALTSG